jgi:hypothetical protein
MTLEECRRFYAEANLLQLRQPGIGGLYHHSMIPIFERTRLRPLGQLFQSLSKLIPGRCASIPTMFTVWAVNSQEGQQVADHPTLSSVTLDFK